MEGTWVSMRVPDLLGFFGPLYGAENLGHKMIRHDRNHTDVTQAYAMVFPW